VANEERKGGHYIIKNPITGKEYNVPSGKHWAFSEPTMTGMLSDNRLFFGKNNDSFPSFKQFLNEVKQGRVGSSLLTYKDYGHTDEAKKDFIKLFGDEGRTIFETLKPLRLIQNLTRIGSVGKDDIILDFFAGSGTTGHAVMALNAEDKGNRQFICVQMPEVTVKESEAFKAGYKNIAEISKERIRRAGKKIKDETKAEIDYGFKVYKLQKSNYRDEAEMLRASQQKMDFADLNNPLVKDWKPENLLTEILLIEGFPLDSKVEELFKIQSNHVKSISCDDPNKTYKLFVCLDDKIESKTIEGLTFGDEDKFICLDSAISDTDKLTLSDKAHLKVI
jgi:adenine-specific DNA-methyltransferase